MGRKWTTRRVTRDIIILLLVLAAAIMAPVAYLASQARRDVSEQFIQGAADQAAGRFRAISGPMEKTLRLVRGWGASEAFALHHTDDLARLLFPLFETDPLLHGVSVADTTGESFYLNIDADGFRSSHVSGTGTRRTADVTCWTADFEAASSYTTNSSYDPTTRPWFKPSLQTEGIAWADPYIFFTSGDVGVTASTSYRRAADGERVVVAFDIRLDDLFGQLSALPPSPNSQVFIFRRDGRVYFPGAAGAAASFIPVSQAQDALVRRLRENGSGGPDLSDKVVSLIHEGQTWWSGFRPLDAGRGTIWICVMVPEQDIRPYAGQRSKRLWLIAACSLLAASGLAVWMIRRYGRPAESTEAFDPADPVESVRRVIAGGESRYVEFKSTMRMNLHSKKPGKEIELAWMKGVAGFLNTDGGILLIGVTDAGEITGLERDVFENEDKCRLHFKNLVARHIGADHSKYIRLHIVPIDELTVGVVCCERSSDPIFMKDGNKEHFYIRNGPSSDELPVSQALNYINHRDK